MLPASLERIILQRKIDSFQKIWFFLFLHQRSGDDKIDRDYVRQVTFADAPALDEVINELRDAGLLTSTGEALGLRDSSEIHTDLDTMAHVLGDPTGRQELWRRLYRRAGVPL